jgi:HAMP domain-containing protein
VTERVLWIAVGVVLVVAAHLLPALCRSHGWRLRVIGAVLWLACMAATCYGHAVFFVMAQKHAGELRAAAVPVVVTHGRGLAEIAADRVDAVARLARVTERRCGDRCATVRIERATLTARLDALDVEAAEAKRAEAAQDSAAAARDAAMADPVTGALTVFGLPAAHADLVAGLAFAAVLEGVACFAWLLALRPVDVSQIAATPVTQGSNAMPVTEVTGASNAVAALESPVVEQPDDITRVMTAVAAGTLRSTVSEIRKFLGCSQARAAEVRKLATQNQDVALSATEQA